MFVWTAAGGRENLVFGSSIANDRSEISNCFAALGEVESQPHLQVAL